MLVKFAIFSDGLTITNDFKLALPYIAMQKNYLRL